MQEVSRRRLRILIVDDDRAVLLALTRQLGTLGWDARGAVSAQEALAILAGLDGVDAVLTDIQMPGMDGFALQAEVAHRFPGTTVVLMSAAADPAAATASPPAPTILRKPFSVHTLTAVLERVREERG
ncbi:MAG: response regulator [Vicinamibacterales bacterium]